MRWMTFSANRRNNPRLGSSRQAASGLPTKQIPNPILAALIGGYYG
jgi:hypothetical protein